MRGAADRANSLTSYFTDMPQVLMSARRRTQAVSEIDEVPTSPRSWPGAIGEVTVGKTIYGLPTSNDTQGRCYNRKLFSQAGLNPNDPPTPGRR